MLRDKSCSSETSKLQFSLYAKQSRTAPDERRPGSHAHITGFYILDYFILFALIGKLEVLVVKFKCRIGIVGHVKLHLVANRCLNCGLNLLVKVEISLPLCRHRQSRVVGLIGLDTHL